MIISRETWETDGLSVYDLFHCYRVAELSIKLAKHIGIEDDTLLKDIYTAAIFHDIGKSMINKDLLNKPGKLNEFEKRVIQNHVELGVHIGTKLSLNAESINYIKGHHENYDGTGYPLGLKGDEISIGARIIKICDVYDALCMDRPYRKGFNKIKAINIMEDEKNTFDPELYSVFKQCIF